MRQQPCSASPPGGPARSRRRLRRTVAAAVATIAGLTANAAPHASAVLKDQSSEQTPSAAAPRRTAEQVRAANVAFRKKFGLPHDDAALAAADTSPAPEAQARYGATLTAAEYAEQVTRDGWADAKAPLLDALQQRRDEFAGAWIDHHSGGAFVVMALPGASPLSKAAVLSAAPAGAPVRFESAQFSSAALDAAHGLVKGAHIDSRAAAPRPGNPLVALRQKGFDVLMSGIDARANRLLVGVKELHKERLAELQAAWDGLAAQGALPSRAAVHFWRTGAAKPLESRYESPVTMKGGLELYENLPDGYRRVCTSNVSATGGVVLTAGHCFGPKTSVHHARHNVAYDLAYDGYFNGSLADVEALRLRVPRMASRFMFSAFECTGPYSLPGDTCQQVDKATGVHGGTYLQEERVCAGGATTYWIACGPVKASSTPFSVTSDRGTVAFDDQAAADLEVNGGTSGGVVGLGGTVHGIVSSEVPEPECLTCIEGTSSTMVQPINAPLRPGWLIFSKMSNAVAQMNRQIVTSRTWVGITSAHAGGMCADVQNNLLTNGTPVWSWSCDGNAAQRWQLEPYGSSHPEPHVWWTVKRYDHTSKCMDIDTNADNGARVQAWDCNSSPQQTFRFDKYGYNWSSGGSDPSTFRILSMRNQKCVDLDISAGGTASGTKIQQWTCIGATQRNQYWKTY